MSSSHSKAYLFFCGLLAGAADVVPGISGGTVYFVMGIYQEVLQAVAKLTPDTLLLLPCFQFRAFCRTVPVSFLLALGGGVVTSFLTLAHLVLAVLQSPAGRQLLYALFMGLVIGSFIHCLKRIKQYKVTHLLLSVAGGVISFVATSPLHRFAVEGAIVENGTFFHLYAFIGGLLAVTAMLLPGISGSYLLAILGLYAPVLTALVSFLQALSNWQISMPNFVLLYSVGLGIVIGAPVTSKAIKWALMKFPDGTIALLSGCMIGSLQSIWPFFTYEFRTIQNTTQLVVLDQAGPTLDGMGILVIFFTVLGCISVLALEKFAQRCSGPLVLS